MEKSTAKIITQLHEIIPELNSNQIKLVLDVIQVLCEPYEKNEFNSSWIFTKDFIDVLCDFVRIHHALSDEPFTKDKFEYALDRTAKILGISSTLPGRTNPGHDIKIQEKRISLKTQADNNIKLDYIHISKFMELGKGKWETLEDLMHFRDLFLEHMNDYEMIITFRCLSKANERESGLWKYEMIEIPKSLFQKATNGKFEMRNESKQYPKPGYCYVKDNNVDIFQLYFDGGGERKMQVKNILKKECKVICSFSFRKK